MAKEFKLSLTASEINENLNKIGKLSEDITELKASVVQADWNAIEGEKGHVLNRTHWAKESATTWTALEETTFNEFLDGYMEVAGEYTFVDGAECTVTWDGTEYISTCEKINVPLIGGDALIFGNRAALGIEENAVDNGQPFAIAYIPAPSIICFMTPDIGSASHTIKIECVNTVQEIHKLDNKYIDAEWMAKKVPATTIVLSETTAIVTPDGIELPAESYNYDLDTIMSAKSLDVIWNGETYKCACSYFMTLDPELGIDAYTIGNVSLLESALANSGEPFVFMIMPALGVSGVFASSESEATFSILDNTHNASAIPYEFLPEPLQFGYEYEAEVRKDAITWDGDTTGQALVSDVYYYASNAVPTYEQLCCGGQINVTRRADGVEIDVISYASSDVRNNDNIFYFIGTPSSVLIVTEAGSLVAGLPQGIYFVDNGAAFVSNFTINGHTFAETGTKMKTIDPKYLPESVGGVVTLYNAMRDDYIYKTKECSEADRITKAELENIVNNGQNIRICAYSEESNGARMLAYIYPISMILEFNVGGSNTGISWAVIAYFDPIGGQSMEFYTAEYESNS